MKTYYHYSILFVLFFSTTIVYSQSPWTQKKGSFYSQINFSTISNYDEVFGDPDYNTYREITDQTYQLYVEYGITDNTTILINTPFKHIKSGDISANSNFDSELTSKETVNSFGNVELGVKHNFLSNKLLLTGQLNLDFNTSTYDESSGIRTGYDAFTITPIISIGKGFSKSYFQAFTGFNLRTNNFSSNYKIGGEGGYKLFSKLWLIAFLDFVISLENGDYDVPLQNSLTALYVNDQEYTAYGFKAIGEISPNFGIIAGVGGSFTGNNVAKKAALNIGIYFKK